MESLVHEGRFKLIKILVFCSALLLPTAGQAEIIGTEDGRAVTEGLSEAQVGLAEVVGRAFVDCGSYTRWSASHSLIRHMGELYVVGAAHAYYKNGEPVCNDAAGFLLLDRHLVEVDGVNANRGNMFQMPALNHDIVMQYFVDRTDRSRLFDFVIFKVTEEEILTNQFGQLRSPLVLARLTNAQIIDYAQNNSVTIISHRPNFMGGKVESIESGCAIGNSFRKEEVLIHFCDTGPGSSGSALLSDSYRSQNYHLGVHVEARMNSNMTYDDYQKILDDGYFTTESGMKVAQSSMGDIGNGFVPSGHVLSVLESLVGVDYYNPELWLSSMDLNDIEARKSTVCAETPALCQMYTYAVSDFLRSQSPDDYPRAAQILRLSAIAGFGPALMDLAALHEFDTAAEIQPLTAQWPRGAAYYEHLFNLKPQFPTDTEKAAAAYILALQYGDGSLLARTKDGWPDTLARAMQTRLADLGAYSGPIDGDFGRGSMAAIARLCQCE